MLNNVFKESVGITFHMTDYKSIVLLEIQYTTYYKVFGYITCL